MAGNVSEWTITSYDYEYQDSARSYIGFRTVQSLMGVRNTIRKTGDLTNRR